MDPQRALQFRMQSRQGLPAISECDCKVAFAVAGSEAGNVLVGCECGSGGVEEGLAQGVAELFDHGAFGGGRGVFCLCL